MNHRESQKGFTIVELLIVIVVIGILAAISIVAYSGIQSRSYDAGIQTDMKGAGNRLEMQRIEIGTYPAQTDVGLEAVGVKVSKSLYDTSGATNFLYCGSTTSANYALVAVSKSGKTFAYGSARAFSEYTANPISSYTAICSELVGSGSARYGYSAGWRAWAGGN